MAVTVTELEEAVHVKGAKAVSCEASSPGDATLEIDHWAASTGYYRVEKTPSVKQSLDGKRIYTSVCLPLPRK